MFIWESLSILRTKKKKSTRLKMDVPVVHMRDFQSHGTLQCLLLGEDMLHFLIKKKKISFLAELINYYRIGPNPLHHSYQAAPNPSRGFTEMWKGEIILLVDPRRQNSRQHFSWAKASQPVFTVDCSEMRSSKNTYIKMDWHNCIWLNVEEIVIF